ncbi:MAG: thiamine-phosphate pyrophosphorylase [Rickettsiales bacterium]|jgi:thiamine-phosphate pyrophosphorylase
MSKIYLISPPQIDLENFLINLDLALKTKKISVFQLRIKGYSNEDLLKIAKKSKDICRKNSVPFIINDRFDLALEIGADGVHLGSDDGNIAQIRKDSPENFIIGTSCYDSKHLAAEAVEAGADYVSFGTFFASKTKNSKGSPTPEILDWCDEILPVQSVAIGGIDDQNFSQLSKADFIAVISFIWSNENGVEWAIDRLSEK